MRQSTICCGSCIRPLTRQMAIEYAVLFDLLLPVLARANLPMPLGGTSNHFRLPALRALGGWDPYNVTEDADLGLRLARFGWRSGMIFSSTLEEAPCQPRVWMMQRVRWLKGWMQTLIVHLRSPVRLWRELGAMGCLAALSFVLGMVASALLHPFFVALTLYFLLSGTYLIPHPDLMTAALGGASLVVLLLGYGVSVAAGFVAAKRRCPRLAGDTVWMPAYWLLISLAGWWALVELFASPSRWHKTKHGLTKRPPPDVATAPRQVANAPAPAPTRAARPSRRPQPQSTGVAVYPARRTSATSPSSPDR